MDRANDLHRTARVDLPTTVHRTPAPIAATSSLRPNFPPSAILFAGVVSFLTFGGAIVVTATMVALQIQ